MEPIRGIKIKRILLHLDNWNNFYNKYKHLIRDSIIVNVAKILACKTSIFGYHQYVCNTCNIAKTVFHTCKSRLCSSCGKKATEEWISKQLEILPQTPWQHITFTLPQELREFFWLNRKLFNQIAKITASIITKLAKYQKLIPGIFLAIHTFGRDLKANVHFHLSTTAGGLSLDYTTWKHKFYINHQKVKNMWKYLVLKVFGKLFKEGSLRLPSSLSNIKTFASFNSWLSLLYQKSWVVFLQKPCTNHKINVKYLGLYLKRPPIAETRITKFEDNQVSFVFKDHHDKQRTLSTMSAEEFIKRLIQHIPDKNFRLIRYYNWLSNRHRAKLLPKVYELLKTTIKQFKKISYTSLFQDAFGNHPLECVKCKGFMQLEKVIYGSKSNLEYFTEKHIKAAM